MTLFLKISGGTFYQIQTEYSALSQRIDPKPLTDRQKINKKTKF